MKAALVMLALVAAVPARADPPKDFTSHVEALRKEIGVPGMAIAIVENGKVTLAKGFGVRKLGGTAPVDAATLFCNGSTTKAFTVAALAQLVDQGKIGWDDKVIDHLPGFQMYDPWVTREMTIRDLLVHRSGLGLGLVPRVLVEDELAEGALHSPCGSPVAVEQGHFLCFRPDRMHLPAFAAFRDWLLAEGARSRGALG